MSVISKQLFYEIIKDDTSCDLIHTWNQKCLWASFSPTFLTFFVKGVAKFFLPIYIMKLILNYRKKKDLRHLLVDLIRSELRTIVYGMSMGMTLISSICLLRQIFGRIYYYNLLMVPGFMSSLSILIETEENQVLDTLIFFNSFVETLLRRMHLDRLGETLLFMAVSGFLMHLLERRYSEKMGFTHFWFYIPPKKSPGKDIDNVSDDTIIDDNTGKTLLKHFMNYFSLGYGVNVVKRLIPKSGLILKKPSELLKVLFSKSNAYFGLFIGSYVTIHRIATNILKRTSIIDGRYHGFLSGLLCGLSYTISPNLQVLVIAVTTSLQMIYEFICIKTKITNHYWQRFLVYALSHGMMLHNKFLYPDTCSPYYKNMIDACTDDMTKRIYENLLSRFFLN